MASGENEEETSSYAALFQKLNVDMRIRKAIARMGIVHPTLVQAKCLDLAITKGRDLVCRAKTGSGKTLAYLIPIVQKILSQENSDHKPAGIKAVILVPTKELVAQVYTVLQDLTYYCSEVVSYQKILSSDKQEAAMLRDQPSIVIATPAGLLKHVRSGTIVLKNSVESICLDEADLILSFGYAKDVTELVRALPKICQGFLLSATLSPELDRLKRIVLNSPAVLKLEDERVGKNGKLMQFYLSLPKKDKQLVLYVFLKLGLLKGKGLFFVNTTDSGYSVKLFLEQFHIRSAVLNAELPLQSRVSIIEGFNAGNFDYLIATDESMDVGKNPENDNDSSDEGEGSNDDVVATADDQYGVARGVDFRNVSFVVNVDFPPSPQSYTHRIGRTARAGAKGVALSLVDAGSTEEAEMLENVQAYQPKLSVPIGTDKLAAATPHSGNDMFNSGQEQPSPLDFDLSEIEGFRYRVEDVGRAVTKVAVRETRSAELRAEILNSERLKQHFEENPQDLQLLRHDRQATHISKVKSHLKNVPKYLLPRGMQVAEVNKRRKRRRVRSNASASRRMDNDPLQSFEGSVNLDGVTEGDALNDEGESDSPKVAKKESKIITYSSQVGESSSGRKAWKMRHNKGKWSKKS